MARTGRGTLETPEVRAGGAGLPLFRRRARFYVDGFNLHHALLDLGRPELLWLDLKALGRGLLPRGERLAGVTWVAAHRPQREDRMSALATYELALRASGVRCLMGHFVIHGDHCRACGHSWMQATEKQSDVNLALALAADAAADRFDVAYLLTTDGDHAATARFLQESYPRKRLVSVAPPGRGHNRQVLAYCHARTEAGPDLVARSPLPERVKSRYGWLERPDAWRARDPEPPRPPPVTSDEARRSRLRLVVSNP
jgi:hypothetical protein